MIHKNLWKCSITNFVFRIDSVIMAMIVQNQIYFRKHLKVLWLFTGCTIGASWQSGCSIHPPTHPNPVVSTILSVIHFDSFWYCGDCYQRLSISFIGHSCSKNFLWRLKVNIVWVELLLSSISSHSFPKFTIFNLHKNFLEQLWCRTEKRKPRRNSLHNTKTSRNELQIILWRLLV